MPASTITGLEATITTFHRFVDYAERGADRIVAKYGLLVETRAKKNLEGGASGPRRIDTGFLRAAIHTELKRTATQVIASVISPAQYSVHVHYGTSKMAPNYFLQEALDYYREEFINELKAHLMAFRP